MEAKVLHFVSSCSTGVAFRIEFNSIVLRLFDSRKDVLAGRSLGTEGGGLGGESGLVVLVALLDKKSDTAVLAGNDTDGLFHRSAS
jgi:hypothetical protein